MPSKTVRFGIVLPNNSEQEREIKNYLQTFTNTHHQISNLEVTSTSVELNKTNMVMYCKMKVDGKYDFLTLQDDFDDRYPDYTVFLLEYPESKSTLHKIVRIVEIGGAIASLSAFVYLMYQISQLPKH